MESWKVDDEFWVDPLAPQERGTLEGIVEKSHLECRSV
jgi:hypothetical protein